MCSQKLDVLMPRLSDYETSDARMGIPLQAQSVT